MPVERGRRRDAIAQTPHARRFLRVACHLHGARRIRRGGGAQHIDGVVQVMLEFAILSERHGVRQPVRINAEQIGFDHHLRGRRRQILRHAPAVQDAEDLRPHPLRRHHQQGIGHVGVHTPNTLLERRSTTSQAPLAASRRSRSCAAAMESGRPIGAGGGAPAGPSCRKTSVL